MKELREYESICLLRRLAIIVIAVLFVVFSMPLLLHNDSTGRIGSNICIFAASSNGADAHSKSMSVGSGDPDVNTEKKTAESDTDAEPSEYDDSQVTGEDGFDTDDVVKTGDDAAKELDVEDEVGVVDISKEGKTKLSWVKIAVIVVVALMALGAAILLFRSRGKDKKSDKSRSDRKYVSKH